MQLLVFYLQVSICLKNLYLLLTQVLNVLNVEIQLRTLETFLIRRNLKKYLKLETLKDLIVLVASIHFHWNTLNIRSVLI
jgi:hypothetical protein